MKIDKGKVGEVLSEFLSTFLLVLLGCMGCIYGVSLSNSHLQYVLNFGLVALIMVQLFYNLTGPHMNPAITLAAVIYERTKPGTGLIYLVAQLLGAILGYGLLILLVPKSAIDPPLIGQGLCVTIPSSTISLGQAVGIEFILTMVLTWVWCALWDPKNESLKDSVAVRFGLAFACLTCTGASLTGASMNPARSLGPALWHNDWTDHWVYWLGPLLGGALGALFYKYVFKDNAGGGDSD